MAESPEEYTKFEQLWISACAVYPVLRWPLTVYLGQRLADALGRTRPDLDAHVPLARHPWFRKGVIPEEARASLIAGLTGDKRRIVLEAYRDLLSSEQIVREHAGDPFAPEDDPIFARFLLGERRMAIERRIDDRIVRLGRSVITYLDARMLFVACLAILAMVSAVFSTFWLTRDWSQKGENIGDPIRLPEMVVLPDGAFVMGTDGGNFDEAPTRRVEIRSFEIARMELTRAQYNAFLDASEYIPDGKCIIGNSDLSEIGEYEFDRALRRFPLDIFQDAPLSEDHPATCISWDDARAYLTWLNEIEGLSGKPDAYRLPTEAEWEFAARARTQGDFYWDEVTKDPVASVCGYANSDTEACEDGYEYTAPVGRFLANAYGLHDMSGNIWEWVEDCWSGSYEGAPVDGSARLSGPGTDCSLRVLRGGSWNDLPRLLRSAYRFGVGPEFRISDIGFRPARTLFTP